MSGSATARRTRRSQRATDEQHDPERELEPVDARVGEERRRAEVRRVGVRDLEVAREVEIPAPELRQPDRSEPTSECHRDVVSTEAPTGRAASARGSEQRDEREEEEEQVDRAGAQIVRPEQRDRREPTNAAAGALTTSGSATSASPPDARTTSATTAATITAYSGTSRNAS